MKLSPKSAALVKLVLWAGLLVWMIFIVAMSVAAGQVLSVWCIRLLGDGIQGRVMAWVAPIWSVFTAFMLCWAVARFANKRLKRGIKSK